MAAISHSRRLRQKIERALPRAGSISAALVEHPCYREAFPEFLITVHQMIRATVPLMRTALDRCRQLTATDAVAAGMVPYFEQHIQEEMHHDDWLLDDLERIGVSRAAVLARMPSPAVASLAGAQYYWIHHHHPVAKLGQIAVMEGYPSSPEAVELMQQRTGYPPAAFHTLEKHCHLDQNHRDDFDEMLDALPLTDEHHQILGVSALHTVEMVMRAYGEVLEQADSLRALAG